MEVTAVLVKAFTKNKHAGNPAGVILNADHLTQPQMQSVAKELGFSESVFVMKSDTADYKMRYFSVLQEVDYCAHATVAAAHVLKGSQYINYETKVGKLKMMVEEDSVTLTLNRPEFGARIGKEVIADALCVPDDSLSYLMVPQIVSTGVPKLMVRCKSLNALLDMNPDFEKIKRLCTVIGARGIYAFTSDTIFKDSTYHARQFNPLSGINEDPITGVAAGALGAFVSQYNTGLANIIIEQGYCMDKFGTMEVLYVGSDVFVKGNAVIYGERVLTV